MAAMGVKGLKLKMRHYCQIYSKKPSLLHV